MSKDVAVVEDMTLVQRLGQKFDIDKTVDLDATLQATAFKTESKISPEQMTSLLVVANQYGLNPFTREIFAFPDKGGGIVPVVGVDGWARIINNHAQLDGIEFKEDKDSCTCIIYRKDRKHPVTITEYLSECKRGTPPWASHPKRMLRHKALIQCARIAFGFGGIYELDEAERIAEVDITNEVTVEQPTAIDETIDKETGEINTPKPVEKILSIKTDEEVEAIENSTKEFDLRDTSISLLERIDHCKTLEQVKSLEPEFMDLKEGKDKVAILAAGKARFNLIKKTKEKANV